MAFPWVERHRFHPEQPRQWLSTAHFWFSWSCSVGPRYVLCSGCWLCGFWAFLRTAPTRWHEEDAVVLCDDRHILRRIAPTHRYPAHPTSTAPLQLHGRFTCKSRDFHHSAPRSSLPCICHYLQGLMVGTQRDMTPKSEQNRATATSAAKRATKCAAASAVEICCNTGCWCSSLATTAAQVAAHELLAVLLLLMLLNWFLCSGSCLCSGTTLAVLAEGHSHQVQRSSCACVEPGFVRWETQSSWWNREVLQKASFATAK